VIKIAYNYQIFTQQKFGGVSRIFSEIAPLIDKSKDFEVKVYAGLYQNYYLSKNSTVKTLGLPVHYLPKTTRLFEAINPVFAKIALGIDKPDIVHETYYGTMNIVPKGARTVLTVLDMIHERFADSMGNEEFLSVKANAIKRADTIICISENTKKDLVEILKVNPAKISVVYLGHAIGSTRIVSSQPVVPDPYLLYVGPTDAPYKNFDRLLRAYGSKKRIYKNFKLVCFGPRAFPKQILALMDDIGIERNNICHYSGNDVLLADLYTNSAAFVYPSLYEGFGIPPLEAMSFNCPVICSNASSIPEVVGDAGEYFDPYDIESISAAIEKVLFSSTLPQEMISRGQERTKKFSWEKCAEETEKVYCSLLGTI
jgi:glycosyltransferase involved in cell wall biosynthesis